ncbi:hypothetical protein [Cohnella sp.]|uniref:hypothetical protein n=1 Tax=Cohnella sp. TaxID=1883426 RepID=UPI0035632926
MRKLFAIGAALLLAGIVWGAGTAAAEGAVEETTASFASGFPACHAMPEDDGKPIKLASVSDGGSAGSGEGPGSLSLSGLGIAAGAAAVVGSIALFAGYLTFRIGRRRFQ